MRTIGDTRITVHTGDITELDVDAVVNAANNHLWMGSGVAGAIRRKGGIAIEREAVDKGPIPVGESVVTGAGSLKARHVIHAAVMGQNLSTDADKIKRATQSALEKAVEVGAQTVGFPAFGTGVGGFPMDECARIMVSAVTQYVRDHPGDFSEICFALIDPKAAETFEKALDERGN